VENKLTDDKLTNGEIVSKSYIKFVAHEKEVTDLSLAPDGNVMCTAGNDGKVVFWDLANSFEQGDRFETPKSLHQWYPHDQKPISSIKFLDNHLETKSDLPFWRFLLTGAEMNNEIKIWCTVRWICLQTISFLDVPKPLPEMKLSTDLSGNYLLITDIHRRVVYCFEVFSFHDEEDHTKGNCYIRSTNVCFIDTPVLSFIISTVKPVTMMSAEEPPKRRRGVQIQSFTLHQANLYKLQTRILHHDSFLTEVAHSGSGTPAGFLSPTRVLSPSALSGDEQIYNSRSKSRTGSDNEENKKSRSKTPNRRHNRKMSDEPKEPESNANNAQAIVTPHGSGGGGGADISALTPPNTMTTSGASEQKDLSSVIEKLKNNRRSSNSSSVSTTSVTGAIEMTSGVELPVDDLESKDQNELPVVSIPVILDDADQDGSEGAKSFPEIESEIKSEVESNPQPNLLESIFSSARGKGLQSLDSTLTEVTPKVDNTSTIEPTVKSESPVNSIAPVETIANANSMQAMSQLIEKIKQQTESKEDEAPPPQQLPQSSSLSKVLPSELA
jgi:WD40 repeat protein